MALAIHNFTTKASPLKEKCKFNLQLLEGKVVHRVTVVWFSALRTEVVLLIAQSQRVPYVLAKTGKEKVSGTCLFEDLQRFPVLFHVK